MWTGLKMLFLILKKYQAMNKAVFSVISETRYPKLEIFVYLGTRKQFVIYTY